MSSWNSACLCCYLCSDVLFRSFNVTLSDMSGIQFRVLNRSKGPAVWVCYVRSAWTELSGTDIICMYVCIVQSESP